MKKANKKLILFVIIAVILANATIVYAYTDTGTLPLVNIFLPAQYSCSVDENYINNVKNSIQLTNTSDGDAYLRMRIVCYWQDSKGNVVGSVTGNAPTIKWDNTDWFEEDGIYYYKYPVKPGQNTAEFLTSSIVLTSTTKQAEGSSVVYEYYQVVEILGEAIQSNPTTAVTSSWSVNVATNGCLIDPNP